MAIFSWASWCRVSVRRPGGVFSGGGASRHLQVLQSAARMGAAGVLLKPFTASQLLAAVDGVLPAAPATPAHV